MTIRKDFEYLQDEIARYLRDYHKEYKDDIIKTNSHFSKEIKDINERLFVIEKKINLIMQILDLVQKLPKDEQ